MGNAERRMRKVQEEMPFVPVPDILPGREEGCGKKNQSEGGSS